MKDFFDISSEGVWNQKENTGESFASLYRRKDYEPNKFAFVGNPINRGITLEYPAKVKEEWIQIKYLSHESEELNNYDSFETGLGIKAEQGYLYHGELEKVKEFSVWKSVMEKSTKQKSKIIFKLIPLTKGKVKRTLVKINPLFGSPNTGFASNPSAFSSMKPEWIDAYTCKFYCSGNNTYPNYTDIVIEVSSLVTPLKEHLQFV